MALGASSNPRSRRSSAERPPLTPSYMNSRKCPYRRASIAPSTWVASMTMRAGSGPAAAARRAAAQADAVRMAITRERPRVRRTLRLAHEDHRRVDRIPAEARAVDGETARQRVVHLQPDL